MDDIHLIRDVLDDQLLDRRKRKLGKADGIVVILREGKPPRVAYIEMGMSTLAHRIHPRLGRWVERLGKKWGVRHGKPYRIPWSKVKDIGIDTIVDLEADETPLLDWEKWLNKHFIGRIPGGSN
jgi:sporulation protein YlmC with PRC-barrel domain